MANPPSGAISQMTPLSTISGTERIPVVKPGVIGNFTITPAQLQTWQQTTAAWPVSAGGTGQTSLIQYAVLLGNGVNPIASTAVGASGQMLMGQSGNFPSFQTMNGDATITNGGTITVAKVNGVAFPTSPATNTVPVVTSSNTITYQQVSGAALADGSVTTSKIADSNVTYGKIQNETGSTILGNPTGLAAAPSEITLGATLAFSGSALQTGALTGDVTASANSFATTIAANAVTTGKIAASAVTYAKIQNETGSTLLGNPTGSPAAPSEITLGATLAFSSSVLQTGAMSGDVTSSANSFSTTIAANAVTNAKMAQMSAQTVKANVTGGSAVPTDATPSSVIDIIGNTRGNILYRGASAWSALAVGTSGQILTTNGSGADPSWATRPIGPPSGRITLTSATPVLTSTVSGATTVYYTPYVGTEVPVWNGTIFVPTTFAELSQATTDTTKSPAAVAASSTYDIFVWNDSGTLRATRGPAWSSGTSRGTGAGTSQLSMVNGIWVNTVAITNGPGAAAGTYVGTILSNGSSTIDFIFAGSSAGGTAGVGNIWNMYNRVLVSMTAQDSTASWNYTTATWRQADNSTGNQVSFVIGQQEDIFIGQYGVGASNSGTVATNFVACGVGINSTSSPTGTVGAASGTNPGGAIRQGLTSQATSYGQLGKNTVAALEWSTANSTTTWFGSSSPFQMGLVVTWRY